MNETSDIDAVIAGLGPPPRAYPTEMTRKLPRERRGAFVLGLVFGSLVLVAGLAMLGSSSSDDRSKAPGIALVGALLSGFSAFQMWKRKQLGASCRHLLANGRAVAGIVEALDARRVNGTVIARYQIGYTDALGARRVLKAHWNDPAMHFAPGSAVVILDDPNDPEAAAVVPLDYPDLRFQLPEGARRGDSGEDMFATLSRLGVPIDFGVSTPSAALLGGVIKAGLYNGVRKLESGQLDAAIESFDAVIQTAQRDPSFASVQAAVHEQRGVAHERKGDAAKALADYRAALHLDSSRAEAAAGIRRLG